MKHRIIALALAVLTAAVLLGSCGKEDKPLSLDQTTLTMVVGETATLSAGDAAKIHWSSSDDTVAAVSAGKVSAKKAGTAVITASRENGETASCQVTVTDKLITEIRLNPKSARVEVGKTIQLTASFSPGDASNTKLSWESNSDEIAVVDDDGYVTGISEGVATITCKSENDVQAACIVSVGGMQAATEAPVVIPAETLAATTAPTAAPESALSDGEPQQSASGGGFLFPDSSSSYLSDEEISATLNSVTSAPISQSHAQDAVNEIFARHGYVFTTPSIRAYYESQSWYHADPSYDGTLSDIEQYNIVLLSNY